MKIGSKHKCRDVCAFGKIFNFLIAGIIFFAFFSVLNQKEWSAYIINHYGGTSNHTEAAWILHSDEEIIDESAELPLFMELENGKKYTISTILTYDGTRDNTPYVFFYSHHMFCRAYLDGEMIFSYTNDDLVRRDKAKSPGNIYAACPLPADCQGKEFRIDFIPALTAPVEYELPIVNFGDYPSVMHRTFREDLPFNLITLLSAFLGIGAILFSTLSLRGGEYREGIFIGIFAILFSIYNITECSFDFYMISNPYYTYILNYMSLSLMPVAVVAFMRERFQDRQKTVCSAMEIVGLGIFFLEGILHFSGVMDMREFLPIMHIAYFIDSILIFTLLISMQKNRRKTALIWQMIPLTAGIIMDISIYYEHWKVSNSDGAFTTVGVLLFLLIEIHHVWHSSKEIYLESVRSQQYHEMAFIDSLTGVGNRRAYEAEKNKILSGEKTYQSLTILSADVNDLKLVNDTLGHAAGDYLIRSTANVLVDLTEECGSAFRVGGDEFLIFLYNVQPEAFDGKIQKLQAQITALNAHSEAKLSLAIGCETIYDTKLELAVRHADKKMYTNKTMTKEIHQEPETAAAPEK